MTIAQKIIGIALEILDENPSGLRYSDLVNKIHDTNPKIFNVKTIKSSIWNLDAKEPTKVFKPTRGLFRAKKFAEFQPIPEIRGGSKDSNQGSVKEETFYGPFADWLQNDIEEVTRVISLGGNKFRDKWGTPDVIGVLEARQSDIIKGSMEVISAEIKTDTNQLVTAFGQACSYKLFSHKTYLVVPTQSSDEELSRVDALCQIFSIGLVTFDVRAPEKPDFRIRVRPSAHSPDLYYTNKNLHLIERELFQR